MLRAYGIVVAVSGILALSSPSVAQEDSVRVALAAAERERFVFFARCAPVFPYVEISDEDDDLEDLTHEEIMTAVTSRLRAARILATRRSDYTWRRGWRLRQLESERDGAEAKWKTTIVGFPYVVFCCARENLRTALSHQRRTGQAALRPPVR